MAPTRKSRSVNKRYSDYAEISPGTSVGISNKSGRQKRKLSDMLGSPWTEQEAELFYKAYRKYGKDWKKVASMMRSRTFEMVEALYLMNKAYLSLPEGTASVDGFKAMVYDHYNALAENDNDQESNDTPILTHKPRKRSRGLLKLNSMKGDQLQSGLVGSSGGCLPLLKRRESDGCTVRKRTPRFPINMSSRRDNGGNLVSPYQRSHKRDVDDVAHGAALALTEASQRGGSPQVSQSPYRIDRMKSTPLKGKQKMVETVRTKLHGNLMDEECFEGSSGSGEAENGMYLRDAGMLMDTDNVAAGEVHRKGRKSNAPKENNELDDGGEACSGTGEGLAVGSVGGKFDIEVANESLEQSSSHSKRKSNKKLFSRDEPSGLDALQTLADLSLMIQASKVDSDSPMLQADNPTRVVNDDLVTGINDNIFSGQASPAGRRRQKTKVPVDKEKVMIEFPRADVSKSGKSKQLRESRVDYKALSEGKQLAQPKSCKRKYKSSFEPQVNEEEEPVNKVKCANRDNGALKHFKSTRLVEYSSSNSNTSRTGTDSAISTALLPTSDGIDLPPKRRSRRKMDQNRISIHKEMKLDKINLKDRQDEKLKHQEWLLALKDKASCCLSSYMVRRWCTFEWFYSAIDYPWFAKREFVEYLNHVGLGHIPRLTHIEWGVIRSSLGKPRRFSRNFLNEEREKLRQYRECVRKHYSELRTGIREGLPTDLARPLSVGQRVIALHPKTREVHDGSVLTVDYDRCRIQFDSPELGVAFVMDFDCMPLNLLDNMPEALRRENSALYRFSVNANNTREQRLGQSAIGASVFHASSQHLEQSPVAPLMTPGLGPTSSGSAAKVVDGVLPQPAAYAPPCSGPQIHARETDIRALSQLTRALDKKEAILKELKIVNDDLMKNKNETDIPISENFKKQYATVLLQLKEASNQVSTALHNLRQRNTHPGNPLPPLQKLHANFSGIVTPTNSIDNSSMNNPLVSTVGEIVNNSRLEAQKLVHTAVQTISKIKVDQNAFSSVVAALDSCEVKIPPEYGPSISRSSEQANGGMAYKHKLNSMADPLLNSHASDVKLHRDKDGIEAKFPSELIVSCIAAYHMIQMCSERQYPPADVVQMLDCAVTSLHPRCPQNLPLYREIQMCMGRVKTQILALVPS